MNHIREIVCSQDNIDFLQKQISIYFKKATGQDIDIQKSINEVLENFISSSMQLIRWGQPESIHVFNYMFLSKIIPQMVREWELRKVERYNNSSYTQDINIQDRGQFNIKYSIDKQPKRRSVDPMPFPEISDNTTGLDIKPNSRFF